MSVERVDERREGGRVKRKKHLYNMNDVSMRSEEFRQDNSWVKVSRGRTGRVGVQKPETDWQSHYFQGRLNAQYIAN
jgi:hypothetical protein